MAGDPYLFEPITAEERRERIKAVYAAMTAASISAAEAFAGIAAHIAGSTPGSSS